MKTGNGRELALKRDSFDTIFFLVYLDSIIFLIDMDFELGTVKVISRVCASKDLTFEGEEIYHRLRMKISECLEHIFF